MRREDWMPKPQPPKPVDAWALYKEAAKREDRRLVAFEDPFSWTTLLAVGCAIGWLFAVCAFRDSVMRECPAYQIQAHETEVRHGHSH